MRVIPDSKQQETTPTDWFVHGEEDYTPCGPTCMNGHDYEYLLHRFSGWLPQKSDENPHMRVIPDSNVHMRRTCDNQPELV